MNWQFDDTRIVKYTGQRHNNQTTKYKSTNYPKRINIHYGNMVAVLSRIVIGLCIIDGIVGDVSMAKFVVVVVFPKKARCFPI
jgi:hypothetical protein